ncbi:MAG: hypothetical protein IKW16_04555 [Clostridia bacterium]|nr:hypothetical protein [Clostridia bacterium]
MIDEKKILNSKALESPDKSVIDNARSQMDTPKTNKKRVWKNVLITFASLAVTALILVMCIPAMLPANSGDPNYITIDQMGIENITSIAHYNEENGTNICHFDNASSSTAYYYDDKLMIVEECSISNGIEVSTLVVFCQNTLSYGFEILDNKAPILPNSTYHNIDGIGVQVSASDGKTYLHFSIGNYGYYLSIDDTNTDWQTIFNDFIN